MNKIIFTLLLFSFATYSQTNRFSGTWSNENRKDASKQYVLKITVAESKNEIYGVAEVINIDDKLSTGILEITGHVDRLGNQASIVLKGKNNMRANAVLYTKDNILQFVKSGGTDLIPREVFLDMEY